MTVKDLYPGLRTFLLGHGALSIAVGGTRIHVDEMPQGQVAASIVINEISNVGDHHMEGPSGLARTRVQITSWAEDRDVSRALSLLVKYQLDGYRGVMGAGAEEVTVQGVFFDNSRWIKDDVAKLFGRAQDYFVNFEER